MPDEGNEKAEIEPVKAAREHRSNKEKSAHGQWLTAAEVGSLLRLSASQILKGEGALAELTQIRIGKRPVRYSETEVLEWMAAQFKKAKEQRFRPAKKIHACRTQTAKGTTQPETRRRESNHRPDSRSKG